MLGGSPVFFLKTSYQDPLFYFYHKHTVCHFRVFTKSDFSVFRFYFSYTHTVCHFRFFTKSDFSVFRFFTKSDFVGRTDLWMNLRIEVDFDSA